MKRKYDKGNMRGEREKEDEGIRAKNATDLSPSISRKWAIKGVTI